MWRLTHNTRTKPKKKRDHIVICFSDTLYLLKVYLIFSSFFAAGAEHLQQWIAQATYHTDQRQDD